MFNMLEEFDLKGKVVIVAAGGKSWARELAEYFNGAGARVTVASGDSEKLSEISAALPAGDVLCLPANLSSAGEVDSVMESTIAKFGRLDALVNHLNLEVWKPLQDITEEDWSRIMQANVTPVFLGCRAAGRHMVGQKSGNIVNVISGLAERAVPTGTAYCAGMGAVLELTRCLALEWARFNIKVNAVGVGWTEEAAPAVGKDIMVRYIPAQRRARAEDVLPLVGFLASGAASFLSGCLYTVDGGLMARA
jgi:NAD(P)-dependent dehydrogenase (short-subunit alcohol dehydrogenase family)